MITAHPPRTRARATGTAVVFLGAVLFAALRSSRPREPERLAAVPWERQLCGNFCGSAWCNGATLSEWNSDPDRCGPDYGPVSTSADGQPSCIDACCREHDICCATGGTDLGSTRRCNPAILSCLKQCEHDGNEVCTRRPAETN